MDNAIILYTKLIELDPENRVFNSTIYANRALCICIVIDRFAEEKKIR